MRKGVIFSIRPDFYVLIALSMFLIPVQWVLGWLGAVMAHELSHLLMICILRIKICSIRIQAFGAVIETEPITNVQELLCTLAGPVGGILTVLCMRIMPQIALCAIVQSAYNLLPVYPLDGGRAVRCILTSAFGEEKAQIISDKLSIICMILIIYIGLWMSFQLRLGWIPIVFPAIPVLFAVYKNSLHC